MKRRVGAEVIKARVSVGWTRTTASKALKTMMGPSGLMMLDDAEVGWVKWWWWVGAPIAMDSGQGKMFQGLFLPCKQSTTEGGTAESRVPYRHDPPGVILVLSLFQTFPFSPPTFGAVRTYISPSLSLSQLARSSYYSPPSIPLALDGSRHHHDVKRRPKTLSSPDRPHQAARTEA